MAFATYAAVKAYTSIRSFTATPIKPEITFNPPFAIVNPSDIAGFSFSPRFTTLSKIAFFCFSSSAVSELFLTANSSVNEVPATKALFAISCCERSSSVCFESEPRTVAALCPLRCISSIAAVTEASPPSPLCIPSRTFNRASFTSVFKISENSFSGTPAICAKVSVRLNIAIIVCPMAVDAVSDCWPYLSRVAASPSILSMLISALGAMPASLLEKSTI